MKRMRIPHLVSVLALGLLPLGAPPSAVAGRKEDEAAEKAFLEAYAKAGEDEAARARAVSTLDAASDDVKVSMLLGKVLPRDEAPPVQTAAVKVLSLVKEDKAVKALLAETDGKGAWGVRGPVYEALGRVENAAVVPALAKVLKGSDPRSQCAALFALAARKDGGAALDATKPLLENKQWQVRIAAYEFLGALKDPSTVPLLVDGLAEETGRMRHELFEALRRVSGKSYEDDEKIWRLYAAGGDAAVKEAGGGSAGGAAPVSADGTTSTVVEKVPPTYYGLKIYSDRVVFVVDVSLSMNEEFVVDVERMVRETGAVVSGTGAEGGDGEKKSDDVQGLEWWKIRTRMEFARAQLKHVISMLDKDQWFDIVWYSDSVKPWKGELVPANAFNKVKASEWLDALQCEGGTNTWGGLSKALNLVGRGTDEENYRRGADTIYFMSDGQPSKGDIIETDRIVAALERIHKVRRVKINVAQIGTSRLPFMEDIARVTGGQYTFFNAKGPAK